VKPVRQREDGLAARVLEGLIGERHGAEREGEDVPTVRQEHAIGPFHEVRGRLVEVVGPPVHAVDGVVALEDAVEARDAGAAEADADDALLLDVRGGVGPDLAFEFVQVERQLQDVVIKRRP